MYLKLYFFSQERIDYTAMGEELTGNNVWFNPYDGDLAADRIPGQAEGPVKTKEAVKIES